ncbi:rhodanese-like domain-containing protein [Adhaeribacter sp. BT258]|uniref:Rhodanese-like domain-containing protein n=1 Tax=Adhaeribacter terrigena TaxID=2793070 RepID=A0ABS1BZA6_9BACT|nr:rhodanese-like domain-containing protein [Adhaeribacter terrigena]MBK0402383.1 rhodanese-like domain-containing protein [Adhaeribacter terrigena]
MNQDITPAELKERLAKGENPFIVDVREDWEYQEQNIGALNIPLGALPDRLEELEDHKNDEIIVHCRSGARSASARAFLQQQGFTNVRNLTGGIMAYNG